MRPRTGPCVVLVLVVLAGCQGASLGGLVGTDDGEPEGPGVTAPGMNESGVYDSVELARAHTVGLQGRSYTLEIETVVVDGNGTVRYNSTQIVAVGEREERLLSRRHATGRDVSVRLNPETVRAYADANRTVIAFTSNGETEYIEQAELVKLYQNRLLNGFIDSEAIARTTARTLIRIFLGAPFERSSVERIERDGETAYRFSGVRPQNRSDPTDDVRVEALVGRFGFVERLEVTYPSSGSFGIGGDARVTIRMRYSDVGNTTVERPDWVRPPGNGSRGVADANGTAAGQPRPRVASDGGGT